MYFSGSFGHHDLTPAEAADILREVARQIDAGAAAESLSFDTIIAVGNARIGNAGTYVLSDRHPARVESP